MHKIGLETRQILPQNLWSVRELVISDKLSATNIGLHHNDEANTGRYSRMVSGQWTKENCQKLVESMPKRVT